MILMRMHAAVGEQAHEMDAPAHGLLQDGVVCQLVSVDRFRHPHDVLVDHASRPEVQAGDPMRVVC